MLMMNTVLWAGLLAHRAIATAVFAHYMIGNTEQLGQSDFEQAIVQARNAHIDAFALNMAYGTSFNRQSLDNMFAAADSVSGFQLFLSFDYAGNGPWPISDVTNYINAYAGHSSYYQYNGKPFVSTFEGPGNAEDWKTIKSQTGCFFMPDWSSQGAGPALALADGVADGLFSWAAWPYGTDNMTTFVDAAYRLELQQSGKPYMMPVSPWFYTNLPGFNKNWLWGGGQLWFDRWRQAAGLQPEFVEIITWNDYGESHYIGPLDDRQYEAFGRGGAPYNYVQDKPHDGWLASLPWLIDTYKNLSPSGNEMIFTWFRETVGMPCGSSNTSGNTATQLQREFDPTMLMPDRVYVAALLNGPAQLQVTVGGTTYTPDWEQVPGNGIGIYQGSVPASPGSVTSSISGNGRSFSHSPSQQISGSCSGPTMNWNPIVGYAVGGNGVFQTKAIKDMVCVQGFSVDAFNDLCAYTCQYGYCPEGACVCSSYGDQKDRPQWANVNAYPANGDANYAGLCINSCNWGYCPPQYCSSTQQPAYVPAVSPFLPAAVTQGAGLDSTFDDLCQYSCQYGFCPINKCSATGFGVLDQPEAQTYPAANSSVGYDAGLCAFACTRGFCPAPCVSPLSYLDTSFLAYRSCDKSDINLIRAEMTGAIRDIAQAYNFDNFNVPLNFDKDAVVRQWFGTSDTGRDAEVNRNIITNLQAIYNPAKFMRRRGYFGIGIYCTDQHADDNCTHVGGQPRTAGLPAAYVTNAHVLNPPSHNRFITLCPQWFKLQGHGERLLIMHRSNSHYTDPQPNFPVDSMESFRTTKSAALLHELIHTLDGRRTNPRSGSDFGLTSPSVSDKAMLGHSGLAYGPARAQYLARSTTAGALAAYTNVDNYLFFLIQKFLSNEFKQALPNYPPRGWPADNPDPVDDLPPPAEYFPDYGQLTDDQVNTASDSAPAPAPPSCYNSGDAADSNYVLEQIEWFCYNLTGTTAYSCQTPYDAYGIAAGSSSSDTLWISQQWNEDECVGLGPWYNAVDCQAYLSQVVSGCSGDGSSTLGGNMSVGCFNYQLTLEQGQSSSPPLGNAASSPNCRYPYP